ncbi:uncharacterized protein EV420DRAFT_1541777 [Desarmillaria tabescens]|uniref:Uncharacterized protein n=1 Tax=Armillaria tabescens TaxID=1929756 RepID=A0AA39KHJ8_ARMTA|nr:uncharacterized protein EV420DRAFT_1541777 [Desarmillaria tabescens]KAK0458998.1 hypothetical protein EV420DRAFT_1541777 [Desarmillaria tabescens]
MRRALVLVIVLLHALNTITLAANWSSTSSIFIENRQSFWTIFLKLSNSGQPIFLETGIPALMSTVLADLYMIWCCWIVWGQRRLTVLLPILSLICATGKVTHLISPFHISDFCVVSKIIGLHLDSTTTKIH